MLLPRYAAGDDGASLPPAVARVEARRALRTRRGRRPRDAGSGCRCCDRLGRHDRRRGRRRCDADDSRSDFTQTTVPCRRRRERPARVRSGTARTPGRRSPGLVDAAHGRPGRLESLEGRRCDARHTRRHVDDAIPSRGKSARHRSRSPRLPNQAVPSARAGRSHRSTVPLVRRRGNGRVCRNLRASRRRKPRSSRRTHPRGLGNQTSEEVGHARRFDRVAEPAFSERPHRPDDPVLKASSGAFCDALSGPRRFQRDQRRSRSRRRR